jgi:hypothetical protein
MVRFFRLLPTIILVIGAGLLSANAEISHPYQGITLITRSEVSPRQLTTHVALIDLRMPGIRFKVTSPGGSQDSVRQTTLEFLNQERAQLAINAHFFVPFPSTNANANLVGLAVSEGSIYSPFESQPVAPGEADQSYAIIPFAPALNIDATNGVRMVHRSRWYSDHKHVRERTALWNAVSGSAQIVTDGAKTIPMYGSRNGLRRSHYFSETNSWYEVLRARTAIGITRDDATLVLFTVDGGDECEGMTPGEVADVLIRDYKIWNALNLDGGGSTTMALQDPKTGKGRIFNTLTDNPRGRSVGSNLGVFALPMRN